MEPYWDQIEQIVRESDIVLEILDARMPELSRNKRVEEIINQFGRPKIFVINKCDLVSGQALEFASEKLLKLPDSAVAYVSNKRRRTIKILLGKIRQMFSKYGKRKTFIDSPLIKKPYREAKGDIIVGVVGYPNVGKSSVINALAFKKKAKVASKAGTTHGIHWINAGNGIKLIDTPGVVPLERTEEANLGMISARGAEKLKDPETVACKMVDMFLDNGKIAKLEDFYNVKFEGETNSMAILEKLARAKGHLKKGGVTDDTRTSVMLIRDWQNGKLKLK